MDEIKGVIHVRLVLLVVFWLVDIFFFSTLFTRVNSFVIHSVCVYTLFLSLSLAIEIKSRKSARGSIVPEEKSSPYHPQSPPYRIEISIYRPNRIHGE